MENLTPEINQNGSDNNHDDKSRSLFSYSELNETTPTWKKIVLFIVGYLGFQVIATLVSVIICLTPLYNQDTKSLTLLGSTLINFISYVLGLGVLLLICFLGKDKTGHKIFKPFKEKNTYSWGLLGFFMLLAIGIIFNIIYSFIPTYKQNSNQSSLDTMATVYPALVFIMAALIAPFVEEITYRAGLCDLLGKKNRWLGIILSSILFGLIHFDFSTIIALIMPQNSALTAAQLAEIRANNLQALYIELENLPTYILSGVVLGFVYCKTGSLSTSIFTHFLNNAYSLLSIIIANALKSGATSDSANSIFRIFIR